MSKGISKPQVVEIFSSKARTTSPETSTPVTDRQDNNTSLFALDVTVVSGTNPTLDVLIQDAPTSSGPWSTLVAITQATAAVNTVAVPTRPPMPFIRAVSTIGGTSTPTFTYSLNMVLIQATSLTINVGSQGGSAAFTALVVTSTSATGAVIGPNGATNPTLQVDGSTSSAATGLKIKSAAAAAGLALSVISSGTNENLTIDAKGSGTISLNVTGTGNIVLGRAATGVSLAVTGAITSSGPTSGIGYATGAGGAVSQATDRTTGVTLNTISGAITTQATSLAGGAEVTFTVTNSACAVGDVPLVAIRSGPTATTNTFATVTAVAAGSFNITLNNPHASTADTGAAIINFVIVKAVSA